MAVTNECDPWLPRGNKECSKYGREWIGYWHLNAWSRLFVISGKMKYKIKHFTLMILFDLLWVVESCHSKIVLNISDKYLSKRRNNRCGQHFSVFVLVRTILRWIHWWNERSWNINHLWIYLFIHCYASGNMNELPKFLFLTECISNSLIFNAYTIENFAYNKQFGIHFGCLDFYLSGQLFTKERRIVETVFIFRNN